MYEYRARVKIPPLCALYVSVINVTVKCEYKTEKGKQKRTYINYVRSLFRPSEIIPLFARLSFIAISTVASLAPT